MSRRVHPDIHDAVDSADAIVTLEQVHGLFPARTPEAVRLALEKLVAAGDLFRWQRDDGEAGWSGALFRRRSHPGWMIVTKPVTAELLQDELLALEPFDFTVFLEDVLRGHPEFSHVAYSRRWDYDLEARTVTGTPVYFITKLVRTVDEGRIGEALETRQKIFVSDPTAAVILVVPGVLTSKAAEFAASEGLTVWDRSTLVRLASYELIEGYRAADRRSSSRDRGEELIEALAQIPAGRERWSDYQTLVARLVEYLFVPPLGVPALEVANESRADRRDLVMANMAESGTWALLRQRYKADYVVVDAKNHDGLIGKKSILEVAHYLKWYGPGLFALVACRKGFGPAGRTAAREQWIGSERMIVPITDADFIEMVHLRQLHASPEDVLVEIIRKFRLSL